MFHFAFYFVRVVHDMNFIFSTLLYLALYFFVLFYLALGFKFYFLQFIFNCKNPNTLLHQRFNQIQEILFWLNVV